MFIFYYHVTALKSEERKIIFNRAVAKADNLLKQGEIKCYGHSNINIL